MPLPLPHLDDRDFDQLVDEARNTLPLSAPAWTDHNTSDPGITLLELFAYLTEIGLYRLDRVPPAQYRAFLRLLGFPIRAVQVARTVLVFAQTARDVLPLPSRVKVGSADQPVIFQTVASLDVVRAKVVTVLTSTRGELIDRTTANRAIARPFAPFGDRPSPGDALYLGFDRALGPEGTLVRLYAFGDDAARDGETWRALAAESNRERRDGHATCPRRALGDIRRYRQHYSARVVWDYYDVSGRWLPLPHARDRTRALSISGGVQFRLPKPELHATGGIAGNHSAHFIRCRLESGSYDCPPMVRSVRVNAVGARHSADMPAEDITATARRANHAYRLTHVPVVPGSTRVDVTLKDGTHERWTDVADWDRSGPFDRHYVLDPESGTLRFGDGRQGQVMPDSSEITSIATTYRVGGGASGNVPADTLKKSFATGANEAAEPSQLAAAFGGADAETLAEAEGRAVRELANARCAVTLADFECMASSVPAAPVARAHAIAGLHPTLSCLPAAGCITVVIVPPCVDRQRDPSAALCAEVARYLDRRRPVACELHVVGPQYTTVSVSAKLHLSAGVAALATMEAARQALGRFFHPLSGGPANKGWPVGRGVYRSEVLALLASLPGVTHVTNLSLAQDDRIAADCGNVDVCAHGLVVSGTHNITVDAGNHAGHP